MVPARERRAARRRRIGRFAVPVAGADAVFVCAEEATLGKQSQTAVTEDSVHSRMVPARERRAARRRRAWRFAVAAVAVPVVGAAAVFVCAEEATPGKQS